MKGKKHELQGNNGVQDESDPLTDEETALPVAGTASGTEESFSTLAEQDLTAAVADAGAGPVGDAAADGPHEAQFPGDGEDVFDRPPDPRGESPFHSSVLQRITPRLPLQLRI